MDKVRCPACRGMKLVPKLGGMIGECNMCKGIGKINAEDVILPIVPVVEDSVSEIRQAVENVAPPAIDEVVAPLTAVVESISKPVPKRPVFRKAKA